ncbi:MAG: arylesterase [Rhizobium sp.]|nr:arylesterase [Rhizobium sp.]
MDAENGTRHAYEDRWTSVLQKGLGHGVRVIAEGTQWPHGRSMTITPPTATANGARVLPTILHTHAPLDLVIIMLGTNDMKPVYANNAVIVGHGIGRLVETDPPPCLATGNRRTGDSSSSRRPRFRRTDDPLLGPMFAGRIAESQNLASVYRDLADELGCGFFDAGSVAKTTPVDGVHMDAENTRAVGRGLEPVVRMMLGL